MTAIAAHTTWMTQRQLKALARQPAYLIIQIIQPAIWLFLFGSLFRKVAELPGFGAPSYLDYLVTNRLITKEMSGGAGLTGRAGRVGRVGHGPGPAGWGRSAAGRTGRAGMRHG